MLSPREAFKVGFLGHCADQGMTPGEIHAAVKQADAKLAGLLGDAVKATGGAIGGLASGVAKGAVGWGVPLALAAPPIVGGTLGYGLARGSDIDDTDIDAIKDREVLDEYRRQTERLQRRQLVRRYQRLRGQTGRIFP